MSDLLQFPAGVTSIKTKVDRSLVVTLETRELSPEGAGKLYGLLHTEGWCLIKPNEEQITPAEIPQHDADPGLGGKSPQQRLYNVLWIYHKKSEIKTPWEVWYPAWVEKKIDEVKEQIPN